MRSPSAVSLVTAFDEFIRNHTGGEGTHPRHKTINVTETSGSSNNNAQRNNIATTRSRELRRNIYIYAELYLQYKVATSARRAGRSN